MGENTIPTLAKAIDVLEAIAGGAEKASANTLAKDLGVSPTTCYRILQTFCSRNWIKAVGSGYAISDGLMPVARRLSENLHFLEKMRPVLEGLVSRTETSAKLSMRQGNTALTVLRENSPKPMSLGGRTGIGFHLVFGSSGSVLLAGMADSEVEKIIAAAPDSAWENQSQEDLWQRINECRETGLCCDFGFYKPHIYTISAPVRDSAGVIVAAITLLGLPDEFSDDVLPGLKKEILSSAREAGE